MDRETFNKLVLDQLPRMQQFAIRLTGDPDVAEEIMQEAMVRATRRRRTFRGESRFSTWLMRIVINAFRDHLAASRHAQSPLPEGLPDPRGDDPSRTAAAADLGDMVARMVSALPPRQREVLVLSAYEQLAPSEIGGVLGITEQNVRTNLHHARQRLRNQLAAYAPEVRP